jgi:SAM-dependent methyltransferase
MIEPDPATAALIALYADLPRQGPGDPAALDRMLDRLRLGRGGRAADLGCGAGAVALRLAERRGMDVLALDAAPAFIDRLRRRLALRPAVSGAVRPMVGDMAAPPVAPGSLDLIVSEGAAYCIGVAQALALWRPLVRPGGGLILSECCWFAADPADRPAQARDFWAAAYPEMDTAAATLAAAEAAGWRLAACERLTPAAWWDSYYDPLAAHIDALAGALAADPHLAAAAADARAEMDLFARTCDAWGYVLFAFDAG